MNTVDPVRDALDAAAANWDGTPRILTWLSTYCGTPCDPYHQAVGRNILGGIVARARNPGIKFDTMVVLFGRQGTGKSTLAAILALDPAWFTDSILLGDASKELVLSLAGKLVVEIGEMGMRGNTDANHVKAMISRQVDEGRTAYARTPTKRHRRNIFVGTTNDDEPLQDPTGNRRFLPVRIDGEIDLDALRRDIFQLIGEATALEAAGASFDIPRPVWELAAQYQEAARSLSPIEELCHAWFDRPGPVYILSEDVARALKMAGQSGRYASFMRRLGWRPAIPILPHLGGRKVRVWIKHDSDRVTECVWLQPTQTTPNARVEMRQSVPTT
jgi:predicted P-loop ATPase